MKTYGRRKCHVCGKETSTNGLAYTNHMRAHVRRGEATEHWDFSGKFLEFETVKKKVAT